MATLEHDELMELKLQQLKKNWIDDLADFSQKKPDYPKIHEREGEWMRPCTSPYHNFPSHLYIPLGQKFTHVCPSCDWSITIIGNVITC